MTILELVDNSWQWRNSLLAADGSTLITARFTAGEQIVGRTGNTRYWFEMEGGSWTEVRSMQNVSDEVYARGASWENEIGAFLFRTRQHQEEGGDWRNIVEIFRRSVGPYVWEFASNFQLSGPEGGSEGFGHEIALTDKFIIVGDYVWDADFTASGGQFWEELGAIYIGLRDDVTPLNSENATLGMQSSKRRLAVAFPNPTADTVTIDYEVTVGSWITIEIYDTLGRRIEQIFSDFQRPGAHSVNVDLLHLSSGVYYYRISIGTETQVWPISVIN